MKISVFIFSAVVGLWGTPLSSGETELEAEVANRVGRHPEVVAFRENREAVASNPFRPLYHFSAPMNGIHDPNGLCQWQGKYHLFYQYKVREGKRRVTKWGHTVSTDLIHWYDLPVAIEPTIEKNCFSGQTLVEKDRVIASYQGVGQGMMIATAKDPLLIDWEKHPGNPLIPLENEGGYGRFLDSCIWKEPNGYYYLISGGYTDGERGPDGTCIGETNIFRSLDLSKWDYLGPMFTDPAEFSELGEDIQVPNFWPIGQGKHLLLCFSHKRAGRGYVGTFDVDTARFTADYHFRENHGVYRSGSIHAPSATLDDQGRYLGIFNMPEVIGVKHNGWDQVLSLPRVYSLDDDGGIQINPVEEIEKLRFDPRSFSGLDLPSGENVVLDEIAGRSMELQITLQTRGVEEVSLKVFRSSDGEEYTQIGYADGTLFIDSSRSGALPNMEPRKRDEVRLELKDGEPLKLRIFLDQSIVEIFANGRLTNSCRVYPNEDNGNTIALYS